MRQSFILVASILILLSSFARAGGKIFQYSTIDALLDRVYDGDITVGELKEKGDFGLGTYNGMDGEMIVIDGIFYRVKVDGTVEEVSNSEESPFSTVCFFEADKADEMTISVASYDDFKTSMDTMLESLNLFYAIRIEGTFQKVKVRSVAKQQQPYPPISEIVATQSIFELKDVTGTMVGFRCPGYVKGINVPGYHFHFLTKEREEGGHVLDFETGAAQLSVVQIEKFEMKLPTSEVFLKADFSVDRTALVNQVEHDAKE